MAKSDLESQFLAIYRGLAEEAGMVVADPEREFRFCERRWRFDFAWPAFHVAVEIDGGAFIGGYHNRGKGSHQDKDKANYAAALGWRVLRFDAAHLREPAAVFELVMEALGAFREA